VLFGSNNPWWLVTCTHRPRNSKPTRPPYTIGSASTEKKLESTPTQRDLDKGSKSCRVVKGASQLGTFESTSSELRVGTASRAFSLERVRDIAESSRLGCGFSGKISNHSFQYRFYRFLAKRLAMCCVHVAKIRTRNKNGCRPKAAGLFGGQKTVTFGAFVLNDGQLLRVN